MNSWARLDLAAPNAWFLDSRIASLRQDRSACRVALTSPFISAKPITDAPFKDGCGWENAVRVTNFGRTRLPIDATTCEMSAALAMWVEHAVQPAAAKYFKSRVTSIQNFGGYACRNIIGNKMWSGFRSQHATANALDVSALTLDGGHRVFVKSGWRAGGLEAAFLRDIHLGACRYFRAALGPDYNAAHNDHFHFDRGAIKSCK